MSVPYGVDIVAARLRGWNQKQTAVVTGTHQWMKEYEDGRKITEYQWG
ncbi:MAG: hypothetical protein OXC92_04220 [Flavobacteriaceae bacterium]|nr:hypothetical protein [Flavobacteriaceae bacterium]